MAKLSNINMPNNYFQTTYEPKKEISTWLGLSIIIIIAVIVGGGILGFERYIVSQISSINPTETPVDDFSALNKNDLLHKLFPNLEFENEAAKLSQSYGESGLSLSLFLKNYKEDYFTSHSQKNLLLIANLEGVPHVAGLYHAYLGLFDKNGNLLTSSSSLSDEALKEWGDYDFSKDKTHFGADNGFFGFNSCKGVKYITFVASDCPNSTCCFDAATVYKINNGKFEVVQKIQQESYDVNYGWKMTLSGNELTIKKVPDHLDMNVNECTETDYKVLNWDAASCTFKETNQISEWKTYKNSEYGFEIKYPKDASFSGSDKDFTIAAGENGAKVNILIKTDQDSIKNCLKFDFYQLSENMTDKKQINGIDFYTKSQDDAAMGGQRGVISQYSLIHNNVCYAIKAETHWQDITFIHGATDGKDPTQEEIDNQNQAIQKQNDFIDSIISTFKFGS